MATKRPKKKAGGKGGKRFVTHAEQMRIDARRQLRIERDVARLTRQIASAHERSDAALLDLIAWASKRLPVDSVAAENARMRDQVTRLADENNDKTVLVQQLEGDLYQARKHAQDLQDALRRYEPANAQ